MSVKNIIAIVILFAVSTTIVVGWRFLPKKVSQIILSSMIFLLSALLLILYIMTMLGLGFYQIGRNIGNGFFFGILSLIIISTVLFVIIITNYVKEEEKIRKIFFGTTLGIFVFTYIGFFINMINGLTLKYQTFLPAHFCLQTAFSLPLIYFSKKKIRKVFLPTLCILAIFGGIFTICIPSLIDFRDVRWEEIHSLLLHSFMAWSGIAILTTKQVNYKLKDVLFLTYIFSFMLSFAFFCNWIEFLQSDHWGNYEFLNHNTITSNWSFPLNQTWVFVLIHYISLVIALVIIMIVLNHISKYKTKSLKGPIIKHPCTKR